MPPENLTIVSLKKILWKDAFIAHRCSSYFCLCENRWGFTKSLKKCCRLMTCVIQKDPLGKGSRDGAFSLFPYYSMCLRQFLR